MTHLLDTNICSAHMRRPGGLAHRFFQHAGGLAISTVILAELKALQCFFDMHQCRPCAMFVGCFARVGTSFGAHGVYSIRSKEPKTQSRIRA